MGCITSRKARNAYPSELGNPLLRQLKPNLPPEGKVIVVRLKGIKDLHLSEHVHSIPDPYVVMLLRPEDAIAGNQEQRSSCKPKTLNPTWSPDERFQFVVSSTGIGKIIFSVYGYRHGAEPLPLADAALKLKDVDFKATSDYAKHLKLINPENGKSCGMLHVTLEVFSLNEALCIQEQTVYQYERWNPSLSWGSSPPPGHFLPTDPGPWSDLFGSQYFGALDLAAQVPDKWTVKQPWSVLATNEDSNGWSYASSFAYDVQYFPNESLSSGLVVRRRAWRRELELTASRNNSIASISSM